ncbi:unnamed protein product [Fusarium graminearum]|uniref:Chromosome 2, complete genome n=1 Tax=Gibberella zeae (strain ATCC MYA-4620 / CBS 123657 / FGSC 9075 / NRRL 31084 / PH-1) TaxID=229533 RepID=A0A098DGP5_GIBZE|nr:unnamed protein product [Fusarium graminearum]
MPISSQVSNFTEFQKVIQRGRMSTVHEHSATASNDDPMHSEGPETSSHAENTRQEYSDYTETSSNVDDTRDNILIFLRQTVQWDDGLMGNVTSFEIPNEDWTLWERLTPDEELRAWVWHQRGIDRLGVRVVDQLVIRSSDSDLQLFREVDDEVYGLLTNIPWSIPYNDFNYMRAHSIAIDEKDYKNLFHLANAIMHRIKTTPLPKSKQILQAVLNFIKDIFPDTKKIQEDALRTGQVPFSHVWTLFRPGTIVYEKRTIPPRHNIYEQCFSVNKLEGSVSRYDNTNVLCLSLAEMVYSYSMSNEPGPRMMWTTRHIRQYGGLKGITTEDLGIIPLSIIPPEERTAIEARLTQRGRQMLQISRMPFSFWNYDGPYGIVHQVVGRGIMEEAHSNCEMSLLICRGHLPGYLLSSSIYAVGVLISELRQPVWEPRTHPALMTSFMPDTTLWHDLVQGFFESSNNEIVEARGYGARSSGLILALEGPRIVTISMANQITNGLRKPLVILNSWRDDQTLKEGLDLGNRASFYPSVMLISCNSISELGDYCAGMIDGIVKCPIPLKEQPSALWKFHLSQHFAGLLECILAQQLHDAYALLAQIESRESRIEKVISTAQRLAVVEKAHFSVRHVLLTIKSSVSPDELQKLEDLIKEENDGLAK